MSKYICLHEDKIWIERSCPYDGTDVTGLAEFGLTVSKEGFVSIDRCPAWFPHNAVFSNFDHAYSNIRLMYGDRYVLIPKVCPIIYDLSHAMKLAKKEGEKQVVEDFLKGK